MNSQKTRLKKKKKLLEMKLKECWKGRKKGTGILRVADRLEQGNFTQPTAQGRASAQRQAPSLAEGERAI